MTNKIKRIGLLIDKIEYRQKKIADLIEFNELDREEIVKLCDNDVRQLIMDNLHIDDNGGERTYTNTVKYYNTDDGTYHEYDVEYENPNAPFNPLLDNFEIVCVANNKDGDMVRIKVDCIRRHKSMGAFGSIPDYYWTDWIKVK